MSWYLAVLKKYAVFGGRSRRKEYWVFFLFNVIIAFVLGFIDGASGLVGESGWGPFGGIYTLAALIPGIAVAVRRMHDTDHSGWWVLVPIANLLILLDEGTRGDNRFGPDPKAISQMA